jgi:hypothetical protein
MAALHGQHGHATTFRNVHNSLHHIFEYTVTPCTCTCTSSPRGQLGTVCHDSARATTIRRVEMAVHHGQRLKHLACVRLVIFEAGAGAAVECMPATGCKQARQVINIFPVRDRCGLNGTYVRYGSRSPVPVRKNTMFGLSGTLDATAVAAATMMRRSTAIFVDPCSLVCPVSGKIP